MHETDYLVSFGNAGDFSRFRAVSTDAYRRGDRVVIRCSSGLQLGVVMCPAVSDHDPFLSKKPSGELVRRATTGDEADGHRVRDVGERIFLDARCLARELSLPLEILDVEITLDGKQATLAYVRSAECDHRDFVSTLSRRYDILIVMQNLTIPAEPSEAEGGCGKPDCGQGNGGCTSCTTGGCSTGGCASGAKKEDVARYLANISAPVPEAPRTSLL